MEKFIAILCKLSGMGICEFHTLVENWDGNARSINNISGIEKNISDKVFFDSDCVYKEIQSLKIQILHPLSQEYPRTFLQLYKPPVLLTYFGAMDLLSKHSVAVVGSRHPVPWVSQWMEREFLNWLVDSEMQIVSGGAIGIDQLAHRMAIRSGSSTLVVLPSGIECKYPKNLKSFEIFAEKKQLSFLSEYLPSEPMRKYHFFRRNQLVASLTPVIIVVQAHQKSGSMMTAQFAIQQNRRVLTLPECPAQPAFSGNLQLLFDGAEMIRTSADLKMALNSQGI